MNQEGKVLKTSQAAIAVAVIDSHENDEEISRSLFYLGRALYRYSFLKQKEGEREH